MSTENKIVAQQAERKAAVDTFNKQVSDFNKVLDQYRGQIARALPGNMAADRFISSFIIAGRKKPDIMKCSPYSVLTCALSAAQLGLIPDDALGECYLSPEMKGKKGAMELAFVIGYRGFSKMAYRCTSVLSVDVQAVYGANSEDGDYFDYQLGTEKYVRHKPVGLDESDRLTHVYAIVTLKGGEKLIKVMSRKAVEKVRDESKHYQYAADKEETIWAKAFDDMAMKTVIRRVVKLLPLQTEDAKALAQDEAADYGKQTLAVDQIEALPEHADEITYNTIEEEAEKKGEEAGRAITRAEAKANSVAASTMDKINERVPPKKAPTTSKKPGKD